MSWIVKLCLAAGPGTAGLVVFFHIRINRLAVSSVCLFLSAAAQWCLWEHHDICVWCVARLEVQLKWTISKILTFPTAPQYIQLQASVHSSISVDMKHVETHSNKLFFVCVFCRITSIKCPFIMSSYTPQINFILFICIIRILRQKINCPDIGRNESNQYSWV